MTYIGIAIGVVLCLLVLLISFKVGVWRRKPNPWEEQEIAEEAAFWQEIKDMMHNEAMTRKRRPMPFKRDPEPIVVEDSNHAASDFDSERFDHIEEPKDGD